MTGPRRSLAAIFTVYLSWVGLLTLGSRVFVDSEVFGGLILGLSGILLGIVLPYHLWRTGIVSFRFLPPRPVIRRVAGLSLIFASCYLVVYPAGFLGSRTTMDFFESPPTLWEGLATFIFLLISATAYTLIFWGGLLFAIKRSGNKPAAVIATSLLFSVYHVSQFPFIPMTWQFFAEMFICALLLTTFTLLADCVLPALIVAQVEQFFYFAARTDNPFSDPRQAFTGVFLVLILVGGYELLSRRRRAFNRPARPED